VPDVSWLCFSARVGPLNVKQVPTHAFSQSWPDFVFAFHADEELGPRMPARIAKRTGLKPEDL
jgi:hypothetical protein